MIVEVKNPAALSAVPFRVLVDKMLHAGAYPALLEIEDAIRNLIESPDFSLLLGLDSGEYKGLAIIAYPVHKMDRYPQVIQLYSEGSRTFTRELAQQTVDKIKERGYNTFRAINMSGAPDAVWQKALTPEGSTSKIIGSIAEFQING